MVLLLSACSHASVIIKTKDPIFEQAQKRLERTTEIVRQLDPPIPEQVLFLQAEGFYRYRFSPPPPETDVFLSEAAFAITEFPLFQSLSGSLELQDIRYRSNDSAVQLWETLLADHPNTRLKPLTLYRLGWAYRNVGIGVSGPKGRDTPDQPFDQLIQQHPNTALAALALEAKVMPWKSKATATSRSLLPGGGQLYLGESARGWTRLVIAAVSLVAVMQPINEAKRRHGDLKWKRDRPVLLTGFVGLVALSLNYTLSFQDAMNGVLRYNEAQEARFNLQHPDAP